jgi:hypothetical protein
MNATWLAAAEAMARVLERENAALSALDLRTAAGLLSEKERALAELAAAALPGGPPASGVADVARRLAALADSNRTLLERGLAAQERVVALIVDAARAVRRARPGEGGRYTAAGSRAGPGGAAVALSRRA